MKNTVKFLGIIALVAIVVFSMACTGRSAASAATSGSATDILLDEFEKLVDEAISLIQRMLLGDEEAEASFEELEAKLEAIGIQLEDARSDFTAEQLQRAEEISGKLIAF